MGTGALSELVVARSLWEVKSAAMAWRIVQSKDFLR
jgi:hypothetical protein